MATSINVFSDPSFRADPYGMYDRIRAASPAYKTRLPSGAEVFVVTHAEDVEAGLKDPRLVKNVANARKPGLLQRLLLGRYFTNANMLRADPPEHTRLRALVQQSFTPKIVTTMREHVQSIADRLIDAVEPQGRMDLIESFAFPLPVTVICELLGVPQSDVPKFHRWSGAIISSGLLSREFVPISRDLIMLISYVRRFVHERRKRGPARDGSESDLVDELIRAREAGDRLSEREMISTIILLLIAGHETTVNLIGNGMLALLTHRDQLERLQAQPELIRPAVEEILRFVNPVQMVNRYAAADVDIGGVRIPRGSHLVLMVAAANRDPAFQEDADELDVSRSPKQHFAFGQGIHYCLGAPLARLEGDIAFTTLLRRLPNIRLAVPPEQIGWRPTIELRGLTALPVVF